MEGAGRCAFNRNGRATATQSPASPGSAPVGAASAHIDGVQKLTGGHEEAVAFDAAETTVSADLGQKDHAVSLTRG